MTPDDQVCAITWGTCPLIPGFSHVCFLAWGHGHSHACVCSNTDLEPHQKGDGRRMESGK